MKTAVAVVSDHDPSRLVRALKSAIEASADYVVAVVDMCSPVLGDLREAASSIAKSIAVVEAEGGTCGRIKNAAIDHARNLADYVVVMDGDDGLYPSAVESIERDLERAHYPDLLGHYAFDCWPDKVWGGCPAPPWQYGRSREANWGNASYVTAWRPFVFRDQTSLRYEADVPSYSDGLLCYRALAAHQRGEADVWISFAIDVLAVDRNTPNSNQKRPNNLSVGADVLRWRRKQIVNESASSPAELPAVWPNSPLMTADERRKWLADHSV